MSKNPNDISIEELLKLVDQQGPESEAAPITTDNSVLAFTQTFNLVSGKERVPKKLLYRLYKQWNKSQAKLTQYSFTKEFSNFVAHDLHHYLLDKKAMKLGEYLEAEKSRNKKSKHKSKHWHNQYKAFLESTGLKEGPIYIEIDILLYVYNTWKYKNNRKGHFSSKVFHDITSLYFDIKNLSMSDLSWVGVNEKIKELITRKEVERWRKHRAKKAKNKKAWTPFKNKEEETLYKEEFEKTKEAGQKEEADQSQKSEQISSFETGIESSNSN